MPKNTFIDAVFYFYCFKQGTFVYLFHIDISFRGIGLKSLTYCNVTFIELIKSSKELKTNPIKALFTLLHNRVFSGVSEYVK